MNKKLKLTILQKILNQQEEGFSLPLVLILGLIMVMSGLTMMTRAQGNLIDAIGQKKIEEEKLIQDMEVYRGLAFINEMRRALSMERGGTPDEVTNEDWANIYLVNSDKTVQETVDEYNNAPEGRSKIAEYSYDEANQSGTLVLEIYNNPQKDVLIETVTLEIPVVSQPVDKAPSLYSLVAEKIKLNKSDVIATIACTNPGTDLSTQCKVPEITEGMTPEQKLPELRESIEAGNEAIIGDPDDPSNPGEIYVGTMNIPEVPSIPLEATVNSLGAIANTEILLPRDTDVASGDVYYYNAASITHSSIQVKQNAQVRIYLSGNMEMIGNNYIAAVSQGDDDDDGGGAQLTPTVPTPGQIVIYGTPGEDQTQTFSIHGDACLMGLIHAPKAELETTASSSSGNKCKDIFQSGGDDDDDDDDDGGNTSGIISEYADATEGKYPNIYGVLWIKSYQKVESANNESGFWTQTELLEWLKNHKPEYVKQIFPPAMKPPTSWIVEKVDGY